MTSCRYRLSDGDVADHDSDKKLTSPADHTAVSSDDDEEAVAGSEQADQVTELSPGDVDVDEPTVPPVPDGGWGWAVVAAAFVSNLIVGGVCYMFGIIMPELLHHFQAGQGKTAFVGSVVPGTLSIIGPVASMLVNRFGCRIVSVVGSIIAGTFIALSQFSPNIDIMILIYGVMGGIGVGLLNLPSIVIVGFYFDKRRALANGIAICGTGIGTLLFAPLASYLVSEYGWKGTHLIMGGIMLNGIACGMIYRPLKPLRRTAVLDKAVNSSVNENGALKKRLSELATASSPSLDRTVIATDTRCFVTVKVSDSMSDCSLQPENDIHTSSTEV